jgi:protein ImuB
MLHEGSDETVAVRVCARVNGNAVLNGCAPPLPMRTCVPMIVCVLSPRFALTTAAGDRAELLGHALALAPEPGGVQQVGEVSLAAEAFGIHPGMRLGEALSRCPELTLIAPDPAGVADLWERWLVRLESIGAGVAPERPGLVCFDARGLLALHGGLDGVLRVTRTALRAPVRLGVAPTRFVAVAAATRARARRPEIVGVPGGTGRARGYLAPLPVSLLRARPALVALPDALERLGVATLGELAALPAAAVADRFGRAGLLAHRLARGGDDPLRPRVAGEVLRESLDLPDSALGPQLERALGLLVDRLLARRERGPRTLRAVVLSATLVEGGGTWRRQVVFREALADPVRMRLALIPRLSELPAPAQRLGLAVERFGPPGADQRSLLDDPAAVRASRLREAVRQARAAAGPEAALRVLEVDPGSRVPERRAVLAPFEA